MDMMNPPVEYLYLQNPTISYAVHVGLWDGDIHIAHLWTHDAATRLWSEGSNSCV
jgi:hypothetical protein